MRTPINWILTGIAVSDIMTMIPYIPFCIHFYLQNGLDATPEKYSYRWVYFLLVHINISMTTHTVSMWLAVFLAILRYQCLKAPQQGNNLPIYKTIGIMSIIYALGALLMVPNYVIMRFQPIPYRNTSEYMYRLTDLGIGTPNPDPLPVALFWMYALVGKLIPCLLISVFGGLLLRTLQLSKKRSESLHQGSHQKRLKQHSRTTRMLLAVIVLLLITELPQGILVVMSGSLEGFFNNVYALLGDFIDILALINNSVNFALYTTMSQQFRDTFVRLFIPKFMLLKKGQNGNAYETVDMKSDNHHVTATTHA